LTFSVYFIVLLVIYVFVNNKTKIETKVRNFLEQKNSECRIKFQIDFSNMVHPVYKVETHFTPRLSRSSDIFSANGALSPNCLARRETRTTHASRSPCRSHASSVYY